MSIADELKANPELAEDILSMAGRMSMAYLAVKVREINRENEELRQLLVKSDRKFKQDLADLTEKCKLLQENTKRSIEIIQNQIDAKKA